MSRKAIFMDIDGTLMHRGVVSQRVIDAIQRARAQGHLFFVCTGRSLGNMPKILRDADYLDGYVMGCGMHCLFGDRIVFHQRVAPELVMKLAKYSFVQQIECWYEGEYSMLGTYPTAERANVKCFDSAKAFQEVLEREPVTKMTILGPYRQAYGEHFSEWFDLYDMGTYTDVILRGVTKATGMQHVLDFVGIDRENCIGIGDSVNDLPMIEFAGLGVAMGNAPEGVKTRSDVVTQSVENDGVAAMIEKYVIPAVD